MAKGIKWWNMNVDKFIDALMVVFIITIIIVLIIIAVLIIGIIKGWYLQK